MQEQTTKKFLTRVEAAEYLTQLGAPVAKTTLAKWATVGGGPAFCKFGTRALYTPAALDAWVQARITAPMLSTTGSSGVTV